jgi:hypothetical protein
LKIHFSKDPIYDYTEEEKIELFKCREHYQTHNAGLPLFLKAVRWDRPIQVNEVYNLLKNWA